MRKIIDKFKQCLNWIAEDGFQHICVSALLIFAFGWIKPMYVAPVTVLLIGLYKELYDRISGTGQASWHDVICDLIGISIGMLGLMFYYVAWRI